MRVINTESIPIKLWLDYLEEGAEQQARNMANHPFAFHHVAIMPDAHQGYGMPIGGVLALKDEISPNAVGVDIGCGMCAVKTNLKFSNFKRKRLERIIEIIRNTIPVGFNWNSSPDKSCMPERNKENKYFPVLSEQYERATYQIGSLGGGNHFLEIQSDNNDFIWLMVHSGSRNLGKIVAEYYNNAAKELNKIRDYIIPPSWDLYSLPINSLEGRQYQAEMEYCIKFALANRQKMMGKMQDAFSKVIKTVEFEPIINIAHNYANLEEHFGKKVFVHRKGATSAKKGETGIIPGSQGTSSYIVKGKGNVESFFSCSHGAGRKMGRGRARRELDLKREIEFMDRKKIIHSLTTRKDLDEAPGAYKNIDTVMANQQDLVEILVKLTPIAVIKG